MGPPYLPPGSPAYSVYFANPANRHPPSANPTFIPPAPQPQIYVGKSSTHPPSTPPPYTPPQPQIYTGKSAPTTSDIDPRPVHQGGMSTYDQPGLANWVAANSFPDHPGPTDRHGPTATAHHHHQSRPAVQQSKTTTHDHHHRLESRHGPTATTKPHHSTTTAMPKPRSCLKKGVQFTPSVQARDERKQEGKNRTKSNGTRVKRMACKYCHVKAVGWTVDDEGYCDGCYRDSRERR
ncbi:hypothetical protein HO173_001400 [Letharia columbiana]|uniref:Uncharacterized protein n=1 Tax=Letharia columbiana TaxID=112416 RepID=A0A8H6L9G0_9LECA|nr:uncharacterized protein HO173_001400 [Letharia columbiana]KAF6240727.1 hypothetical protein HO173_001400 [Letharia columbiana]